MFKRLLEWLKIKPIAKLQPQPQIKRATPRKTTMPLTKSKSKEAFKSNVKAEIAAGKPVKQAVAIAYAEKNAATKSKKTKPKRV
jgi:hypothetical protein